jgi:hypothetical protein
VAAELSLFRSHLQEKLRMDIFFFRFSKLVIKIESALPVISSAATDPFVVNETQWDYRICVSSAADREFEINGYGSLRQEGKTFHLCLNESVYSSVTVMQIFTFLPVRQMLFEKNMVVVHASYILYKGQAILFSGDSGIGKSTQADLWKNHLGAGIINGDRTLLYVENDTVFASGWFQSGTSGICNRGVAPVKSIIFLDQGQDNKVVSLSGIKAFKQFICQCSYETANQQQILKVTELAAEVINHVPLYQYQCNMEPQAAEYLKTYLYG